MEDIYVFFFFKYSRITMIRSIYECHEREAIFFGHINQNGWLNQGEIRIQNHSHCYYGSKSSKEREKR